MSRRIPSPRKRQAPVLGDRGGADLTPPPPPRISRPAPWSRPGLLTGDGRDVELADLRAALRQSLPPAACRAFDYFRRLRRLERLVLAAPARSWCRPRAAAVVGLTPTAFSRYFRQKTGLTFGGWLHHVRVSRALLLLAGSDLPLGQVAVRAGFRDGRALRRALQRVSGLAPSRLRQQHLTGPIAPGSRSRLPTGRDRLPTGPYWLLLVPLARSARR